MHVFFVHTRLFSGMEELANLLFADRPYSMKQLKKELACIRDALSST